MTRDPFSSRGRKPKLAPWLLNFSYLCVSFFYFTIFGLFASSTVCIERNIKGVTGKSVENIALYSKLEIWRHEANAIRLGKNRLPVVNATQGIEAID